MATVKNIIYCVCVDHEPGTGDSAYYGMPQLRVNNGMEEHKQFWTAYCPKCGRGGCIEYTSPYRALKAWNHMQKRLRLTIKD